MDWLFSLYARASGPVERRGDGVLPVFARLVFAATLLGYFWASGLTKLGDGVFGFLNPSTGAYAQIFPRAFEAARYNTENLSLWHWAVVTAGTWAEFILPLLIVIGLMTRLAALGMIGFVVLQSLTDLYGHGGIAHAQTLGAWFDRAPDGLILDQRAFWMLLLLTLVIKGAGALSVDRLLMARRGPDLAPA
ncbi:DoxX family protein [Primorskyibacter sp. 2E107]|uniref:DoxX family protein n=1 Tax=Primorskyibacter sp. 2E107 TaxID=3403458 RepID=UPI003AF7AEB2